MTATRATMTPTPTTKAKTGSALGLSASDRSKLECAGAITPRGCADVAALRRAWESAAAAAKAAFDALKRAESQYLASMAKPSAAPTRDARQDPYRVHDNVISP